MYEPEYNPVVSIYLTHERNPQADLWCGKTGLNPLNKVSCAS